MKVCTLLFVGSLFSVFAAYSQCDTVKIDNAGWTAIYADSEEPGALASSSIDGDSTTIWHTEWSASQPDFPHEIQIDMGQDYPVNGIKYWPRQDGAKNGKVTGYEVYLSSDGISWGSPEITGSFSYANNNDVTPRAVYFGAIDARYVKFIGLSGFDNQYYMVAAEFNVFQDSTCGATGQANQSVTLTPVDDKITTDAPFSVSASASSGLPITYEIVSGPATVVDSTITLTGTGGTVILKAKQLGNASYYNAEATTSFEVFDLATYAPTVSSRITDAFSLEMPTLEAYPIYMNASIDLPTYLSIDKIELEIAGQTHQAILAEGFYYYLWTPSSFGAHTIDIKAYGSNGNVTTLSKNITVSNAVNSQNVTTLNAIDITFGGTNSRWYYGTYSMPQYVGSYDQIMANLTIQCPNGDCDDWDRLAYIDIKAPDGNWIQIIRYITPYGVACNHNLEVTDYSSLLQGEFEFRMFIDTWGTGGWLVTLDFDYQAGVPPYKYSRIDELWDGAYDLGNPADLQPMDTITYTYYNNVQKSTLRVSNTGHGWGQNNSQNAAEFYHAVNYFNIDGSLTFIEDLWNTCNPNPDNCTGQQGTWYYDRAGWCPGIIAPPSSYDLTPYISSTPFDLTYEFDPTFQDYCHPNNPNCQNGSTCPDCNDGYKAVFHIDGQIINFSDVPLVYNAEETGIKTVDNTMKYPISVFPNPTAGKFGVLVNGFNGKSKVLIQGVDGKIIKTYYFSSVQSLNTYQFDLSGLAKGTYFITIDNPAGTGAKKIILN